MSLNELKNLTPVKLYEKLLLPDDHFKNWLQELGLLHSKRTCVCGSDMRFEKHQKYGRFVCRDFSDCRRTIGYLRGTFFENIRSPMTLKQVFELSYHWSRRTAHRIKSLWQKLKRRHKEEFGTAQTTIDSHISEFIWKQEFGGNNCLCNIWHQISCDPRYNCEH